MTKQNNALRLAVSSSAMADEGEMIHLLSWHEIRNLLRADAAELRRQHARIAELEARIKTMAEEHADELAVAHLDGRMRAAQPAGAQHPGDCGNTPYDEGPFTLAQQPGAAYAALPDADRDYMRKVVAVAVTMLFDGYKEDVTRVFSPGELSEFVTITAAMGGERVEDIYRRAWDLLSLPDRASHGQAPAQAAPVCGSPADLPPLPDPDLRDVGTKPEDIKNFLRGYATEYAKAALASSAPADSVLEDAARESEYRRGYRHGYEQRDAEVRGALA